MAELPLCQSFNLFFFIFFVTTRKKFKNHTKHHKITFNIHLQFLLRFHNKTNYKRKNIIKRDLQYISRTRYIFHKILTFHCKTHDPFNLCISIYVTIFTHFHSNRHVQRWIVRIRYHCVAKSLSFGGFGSIYEF